jgi:glutathione synthase
MSLGVAIQMDPIDSIDIDADSTFVMAMEAQDRGHDLWYYTPSDLSFTPNRVYARARPLAVRRDYDDFFTLGEPQELDLSTMDVVLLRQDPPFDMAYITTTHVLERIHPNTLVVNDPAEVRNAPEKIFVTDFPEFMPETLITHRRSEIEAFRDQHQDIIIKPLYGNGGAGVFRLTPGDENLSSILEMFEAASREPLICQRYLPEIRQGDKRIILVDGTPIGGVARMPQEGEARANFHSGGTAEQAKLTAREREICAGIGPVLKEKGLVFVGIDVIGDYMTEINVTSPTGIQETNRLSNTKIEADIWDAIERRRA